MSISNHVLKNGIKVGGAKVISNDLVPKGSSIPGRALASISKVTIHQTGLIDVKANNFHRSLKRENALKNGRQASWTFTVDDIEIYQEVKINWETWHAGNSTGNKNSISIEICMWNDKEKQRKSYENAAALVALLLKHYKLDISKVVQHNDWSGKDCPQFLRHNKHGYNWNWFKDRVKANLSSSSSSSNDSNDYKRIVGSVEILSDTLNVRKEADFDSPVVRTLKKGDKVSVMAKQNGLYMIKEGEWCSAGTKYTKFSESTDSVYEVVSDTLNVRDGRGADFKKVGTLKKGDRVAAWSVAPAENGSDWISFRYSFTPNVVGFCNCESKYMKKL